VSSTALLVRMANDIGHFFRAEPQHAEAVAGVRSHIQRFWDPRMRKRIAAHLRSGGEGMEPLAREAVEGLAEFTAGAAAG